jgi:hypothetical protein
MLYLIETYWLWSALALLVGATIGYWWWFRLSQTTVIRWLVWGTILFLIGLAIAVLQWLPGRIGHYLETLLLLAFCYTVGALLGGWLRLAQLHAALARTMAEEDQRRRAAAKAAEAERLAALTKAADDERQAAAAKAAATKAAEEARLAAIAKSAAEARQAAATDRAADQVRRAAAAMVDLVDNKPVDNKPVDNKPVDTKPSAPPASEGGKVDDLKRVKS